MRTWGASETEGSPSGAKILRLTPRYSQQLKTTEWATYREQVFELDAHQCRRCGGAIKLCVHHKEYLQDRKPWNYPFEKVETLCGRCHAEEHGKIPPQSGWVVFDMLDLEEPSANCELCGTLLRYVFTVTHEAWQTLEIGSDCCDRLTQTTKATDVLASTQRQERFVGSSRWKQLSPDSWRIVQRNYRLTLSRGAEGFAVNVDGVLGKKRWCTEREAREAIWKLVESDALDTWRMNRR